MQGTLVPDSWYRLLVESVRDYAIFHLDPEGNVLSWNAGAERLKGYSADEIRGRHFSLFYTPEDLAAGKPERELREATEAGRCEDEGWRVRKDGSRFWGIVVITAMRDGDGRLMGFAKVTRDLTGRKRLEETQRALTERLQLANRELEAFSYSVSHDLRAPLRALAGFSEALLEDYADRLDDQARHYLDRIRAGAARMGRLIDDLLRLARLSRAAMSRERVDLGELARHALEQVRAAEPERRVELDAPGDLLAAGDPQLLGAMMENLLGNAFKFTRSRATAKIEVGAQRDGGEPIYYVRDNGVGFDMKYANKLFQPFQRLHSAAEFEGTGVGLALVQRVVERHGGRVWAESCVDEGATIFFTLGTSAGETDGESNHAVG
jgi:PAS domain S-box-containing protein